MQPTRLFSRAVLVIPIIATASIFGAVHCASAASSFSENFDSGIGAGLTQTQGDVTTIDTSGGRLLFTGASNATRGTISTVDTDYANVAFVATVDIDPSEQGWLFFGMGAGHDGSGAGGGGAVANFFGEPAHGPALFVRVSGQPGAEDNKINDMEAFYAGATGLGDADVTGLPSPIFLNGTTSASIRMTHDPGTTSLTYAVNIDGAGYVDAVSYDYGAAGDGASGAYGFDATNSRIFLGGGNAGRSFDNLVVNAATPGTPEISVPGSVVLSPNGSVQNYDVSVANNSSDQSLSVTGVTFSGTDMGAFAPVTSLPLGVDPASSETLTFSFDPSGLSGAVSATMHLASNDPASPTDVTISGLVRDPLLAAASSLDFGLHASGTQTDLPLNIQNGGVSHNLLISASSITGSGASHFTIVTPPDASIAPAGTSQMTIRFAPQSDVGAVSAQLEITSNDPAQNITMINLTGATPVPPISFSEDFSAGELPANMELSTFVGGSSIAFDQMEAHWGANTSRGYLRTLSTEYHTVDFVFEGTVTIAGGQGGGNGIGFFGLGEGEPDGDGTAAPWAQPTIPAVYGEIGPDDFAGG